MADSEFRDLSAQEIIARYELAKSRDPKLTQGRFFKRGTGDRFKSEESAARYYRLLREGKRSGNVLWAESTGRTAIHKGKRVFVREPLQPDSYQVLVNDAAGNTRSFSVAAVGGRSSFDIVSVEGALLSDKRKILQRKAREWAARYNIALGDLDVDNFVVRKVKRSTTRRQLTLRLGEVYEAGL